MFDFWWMLLFLMEALGVALEITVAILRIIVTVCFAIVIEVLLLLLLPFQVSTYLMLFWSPTARRRLTVINTRIVDETQEFIRWLGGMPKRKD